MELCQQSDLASKKKSGLQPQFLVTQCGKFSGFTTKFLEAIPGEQDTLSVKNKMNQGSLVGTPPRNIQLAICHCCK